MTDETPDQGFHIFEPVDETMLLWKLVATVPVAGREQARNRAYKGRTQPVLNVAVSTHAWQPTQWEPPLRLAARVTPVPMPAVPSSVPTLTIVPDDEPVDPPSSSDPGEAV